MIQNGTIRIEVPPEVALGPQDKPAYIILKTRLKGKHREAFTSATRAAAQVMRLDINALKDNPEGQVKALADVDEASQAINRLCDVYGEIILEWNWIDFDTGAVLPPPSAQIVRDELDQIQMAWLNEQAQQLLRYRATEGNARSGSNLNPG